MIDQQIIEIDDGDRWRGFIVQHDIGVRGAFPVSDRYPSGSLFTEEKDLVSMTLFWINDRTGRPVALATAFGTDELIEDLTDLDLIPLPPSLEEIQIELARERDPAEPPRQQPLQWRTTS